MQETIHRSELEQHALRCHYAKRDSLRSQIERNDRLSENLELYTAQRILKRNLESQQKIEQLLNAPNYQAQLRREDFSALLETTAGVDVENGEVEGTCEEIRKLSEMRQWEGKLDEAQRRFRQAEFELTHVQNAAA